MKSSSTAGHEGKCQIQLLTIHDISSYETRTITKLHRIPNWRMIANILTESLQWASFITNIKAMILLRKTAKFMNVSQEVE